MGTLRTSEQASTEHPPHTSPRSASLAQVNDMLREQLDQANLANQTLSEDIRKVTSDWTRSCKELEQREATWRREEEVSWGSWRGSTAVGCPCRGPNQVWRGAGRARWFRPSWESWPWLHMPWASLTVSSL